AADLGRAVGATHLKALPEVPAAQLHGGTHRARPVSTRFEPVPTLKDVITPVPRVLLSATLAGPAPSGRTGTSRLCRGCSHPPRHHPGQAAPSYTALLRQDGGEGLSPPLEQQRPTAQSDSLAIARIRWHRTVGQPPRRGIQGAGMDGSSVIDAQHRLRVSGFGGKSGATTEHGLLETGDPGRQIAVSAGI